MPFSVYLLRSIQAPLRTYVGVSNNVEARLRAHNGLTGGGAAATRVQRPWEVYAVVSGFESEHRALCFEFAWHYPKKIGYAVLHVHLVKSMKEAYATLRRTTRDWVRGEDGVEWHLRVLDEMLELELWRGMGLNVQYPLGRALPAGAGAGAGALPAARAGGRAGAGAGAGAHALVAPVAGGSKRAATSSPRRALAGERVAGSEAARAVSGGAAGPGRSSAVVAAAAVQGDGGVIVVDDVECVSVCCSDSGSVTVLKS